MGGRGTAKMNAMRSGVIVIGVLAFGYLNLQLGFKPYLEKAQLEQQRQEALLQAQSDNDSFHTAGEVISDGSLEMDNKL